MSDDQDFSISDYTFEDGRKARVLTAYRAGDPISWCIGLGLDQARRVIWLSGSAGGFEKALALPLRNLFVRSVLKVAGKAEIDAVIMDGGTKSGVMEVMGLAVAENNYAVPLLGVAPAGEVANPDPKSPDSPLDANHALFALVPGKAFGEEVPWMGKIAAVLSTPENGGRLPVVMVLAGGNPSGVSKIDVLTAVRAGYPVVVIKKTQGLADKLASLDRKQNASPSLLSRWFDGLLKTFGMERKTQLDPDPELVEIMETGNLYFCALDDPASEIENLLQRLFVFEQNKHKKTLIQAWQRFAVYDRQAVSYQKRFFQQQSWILRFAVMATFFAVAYSFFFPTNSPNSIWKMALSWLVIGTPLIGSGMLAYLNKVNSGIKFFFLRGAAEAIKQAIYIYRTRDPQAKIPTRQGKKEITREQELAQQVEVISRHLMDSAVNQAALPAYKGKLPPSAAVDAKDDGLSDLLGADYIRQRLVFQRAWYQKKTAIKETDLRRINFWIIIFGMLGTFIAAIGLEVWVAVTTSIVTALAAYLNYQQTEQTLVGYNQTATHLQNIESWFSSLPANEQKKATNITLLVSTTEKVLASEVAGWVQNMKDSIDNLKADKEDEEKDENA